MWDALSDETTGLSFTIAPGPRQRSHSRVRVPWDSRPYFTVSDSKLPFLSPPTARRATVEVFDPTSTRDAVIQSFLVWLYSLGTDSNENSVSNSAFCCYSGRYIAIHWTFLRVYPGFVWQRLPLLFILSQYITIERKLNRRLMDSNITHNTLDAVTIGGRQRNEQGRNRRKLSWPI
jgi:hypothetical protein